MADGKRRYKSDRKDHKVSVKMSENDMDILKEALNRTGMTASAYIRELIRTGGNTDTSYYGILCGSCCFFLFVVIFIKIVSNRNKKYFKQYRFYSSSDICSCYNKKSLL